MYKLNTFALFGIMFLSSMLLGNGLYSNNVSVLAQHENVDNLNEAEVNTEIEQENKCKKDTECENENELNNKLNLVNKTIIQTPKASSLTVKKQIFGCDNIHNEGEPFEGMDCTELSNDSPSWLSCDDSTISGSVACSNLTENLFDIQVLDYQNNPVQQFEGSEQGTTIENIEPGTYTVNEIKHQGITNQLGESPTAFNTCTLFGFPDGGTLDLLNTFQFIICFQYEDEQGNDCTQNVINDGEDKVCIVKNYISSQGSYPS